MKKMTVTRHRNSKGFTLAELLIVVAIIGVLVAVSIPVFTSQLDKAKISTNASNIRSAKAAAIYDYEYNEGKEAFKIGPQNTYYRYCYDIATGMFITDATEGAKKCTEKNGVYQTIKVLIKHRDASSEDFTVTTDPAYYPEETELDKAIVYSGT